MPTVSAILHRLSTPDGPPSTHVIGNEIKHGERSGRHQTDQCERQILPPRNRVAPTAVAESTRRRHQDKKPNPNERVPPRLLSADRQHHCAGHDERDRDHSPPHFRGRVDATVAFVPTVVWRLLLNLSSLYRVANLVSA